MQCSGNCLRTQMFHLAGDGFGGDTSGPKQCSQKERSTTRIAAINHWGCVSSGHPAILSVCLSVSPQAAGSRHHSYVLSLASAPKFSLESSLGEKGLHCCSHAGCRTCGQAKKGGRGLCLLSLRQVETGLCFGASLLLLLTPPGSECGCCGAAQIHPHVSA